MKLSDSSRGFANASARIWVETRDNPRAQTLEWLLSFKLGIEKRKDLEDLVNVVHLWDRNGRVGDPFPAPVKKSRAAETRPPRR